MIGIANEAPSVLVAIASYGRAQDHHLARLLAEYRKLKTRVRTVVLSNELKPVEGAEVIAGLPSPDPYSLPFAHRKLFCENAADYDLFIYSEDDTLITEDHIQAFLDAQSRLPDDEIAGFIRSECDAGGQRYITSIHHHFRWLPESVVMRNGELFARLSNEHSGCFIVTRRQLQKAIASGGFAVDPHCEQYGMLETAASDLYTQCGLQRMICISRVHDFIVPHLPNKYYSHMGIPLQELDIQAAALKRIQQRGEWTGKLLEPGSGAPGFRWSKDLFARVDERLLSTVPAGTRSVLSVGCGSGENELALIRRGVDVCAVPLDSVFGAVLAAKGIRTVTGPIDEAAELLRSEQFESVLLADVLHLVDNPTDWLLKLGRNLTAGGRVVASIPNTGDLIARARNRGAESDERRLPHTVTRRWIHEICRDAGLEIESIVPIADASRRRWRDWALKVSPNAFASRFIVTAVRMGQTR